MSREQFLLTVSCADRPGIVARVSSFLADNNSSILESTQFGDRQTDRFFMRVHFESLGPGLSGETLTSQFRSIADSLDMNFEFSSVHSRARLLVMVSKQAHCLIDLLYRVQIGAVRATIEAVVSNHAEVRSAVESWGVPYYHVPVSPDTRRNAEQQLREIVAEHSVDTIVLARYMQVLSDELCAEWHGRAINIHHSLLPAFKGARPYEQAHDRGVKVIGATAHYVTRDLDEGPIIEQDFERVSHSLTPAQLAAIGRDLEARALARAVTAHVERRVMLNGEKTVVF